MQSAAIGGWLLWIGIQSNIKCISKFGSFEILCFNARFTPVPSRIVIITQLY